MRMRNRKNSDDDAEVMLSPLIDCVFLLLIFFLVTSMIKRYERQIPVTLADASAAIAVKSQNDVYLLAIDSKGRVYRENGRTRNGVVKFKRIEDFLAFSTALIKERGGSFPIELVVERQTGFQLVIDVLDTLQLQGFENVRSRVRDTAL